MPTHPHSGHRLGGKVADIVTRAVADHAVRRRPESVRLAMAIQEAFFRLTGSEHKATSGGLYADLLATGALDGWAADTVRFLAHGHGQWQTLLAGQATGAAMGGGLMSIVQNELAPGIQGILELNPHGLLAPADLAIGVARGFIDYGSGAGDAMKSGLPEHAFNNLVSANFIVPNPGELASLYRRGKLDGVTYTKLLERNAFHPDYEFLLAPLSDMLLSPQELAGLVTFGVLSEAEAAPMADKAGMHPDDFHRLVLGNGQPPSTEDLLFAYRRKIINRERLLRGITQGPVRNEWFDVIESLGQVPMSTADAVEASIQGHLSKSAAQVIAEQNGLMPEHFEPLWQTAGSPPGAEAMIGYWRRGFVTESDVVQALTESRLKPKYIPLALKTKAALIPMVQVRMAMEHGVVTQQRALELLADHGYTAEDAHIILASAKATRTQAIHHLSVSQVMALYTERAITLSQAHEMLSALGYDSGEVTWIIDLADIERKRKLVGAAVAVIRTAYVDRRIDDNAALADLDTLLIPRDQQDDLMHVWQLERDATVKTLTLPQATAAYKRGLIDAAGLSARIGAMGYDQTDTAILVALATPAGAP